MSWALLLAISILTATASTLLARYIQNRHKLHPAAFTIVSNGSTAVLLLILALIQGFDGRWNLIPKFNLVLMVFLWALANVLIMSSLKRVEASQFGVIFTTRVIWTILVSIIFLNESLSGKAVLGALILLFSSGLALWEEGLSFRSRGLLLCLAASFFFGLAVANDGIILAHGYSVVSYFVLAFGLPPLALAVISAPGRQKAVEIAKNANVLKSILIIGLLNAISAITIFVAFQKGKELSILASLNQTQTILMVLGAALLLKERRYFSRRLVAAVISFIGVLLIINTQ